MHNNDFNKKWKIIVANALTDPVFKDRLLKDSANVLSKAGIKIPADFKVQIKEEKNKVIHLYISNLTKIKTPFGSDPNSDFNNKWKEIELKALTDSAFKARLLKNSKTVLSEAGIQIPADFKVQIKEENNKVIHLYIPALKILEELSGVDLKKVAGGLAGPGEEAGTSIGGAIGGGIGGVATAAINPMGFPIPPVLTEVGVATGEFVGGLVGKVVDNWAVIEDVFGSF